MIREYNQSDIDAIISLLHAHNELSPQEEQEKRKELEGDCTVLVYEENEAVKGICSLHFSESPVWGKYAKVIMSLQDHTNFSKLANALWDRVDILVEEKNTDLIMTHYNEKQQQWDTFFEQKRFELWFGIHGMIYKGGKHEETRLNYRNYEEADFELYHTNLGKCFYEMRKTHDIRPYDVFQNSSSERVEEFKKEALDMRDSLFLFYDGQDFVGSSIIKQEDIDDVFVVPEHQGKGYGRKIMEATLNLALQRGFDKITLGVVAWNQKAIQLYESLGFERYQSFVYRRLIRNSK